LSDQQIQQLARATGENDGRTYGATYSDLTQRFVPIAVLEAFPKRGLAFDELLAQARALTPTPPFKTSES
jgi:hypothetical protein